MAVAIYQKIHVLDGAIKKEMTYFNNKSHEDDIYGQFVIFEAQYHQ